VIDPRRLEAVDAALEEARRDAREAAIPPRLRARILAATRRAPPAPRARLVDFALRAAAVAAVIVAGLSFMPAPLEAAEFDARPLVEWNARFADAVSNHLPELPAPMPELSADLAWLLAAASAALVFAGLRLARGRVRR
jgi:hypothetical protein